MKKCKIEVLKTTFHEDLAKQYGCKNLGKCPMHKVGDIFYGDYSKPEGLCDEAWKAMYQYVLLYLMAVTNFIMKIGQIKREQQFAPVMTVFAQ